MMTRKRVPPTSESLLRWRVCGVELVVRGATDDRGADDLGLEHLAEKCLLLAADHPARLRGDSFWLASPAAR